MDLTTKEVVILFNALTALRGYNQVTESPMGKKQATVVPFDLSPKAKWNSGKSRNILRRLVEVRDENNEDLRKGLRAFMLKLDHSKDPKENERAMHEETERVNGEIAKLDKEIHQVEGLLLIPADGLNLKLNPISPDIIDGLMPLIDGVPTFEEKGPGKP